MVRFQDQLNRNLAELDSSYTSFESLNHCASVGSLLSLWEIAEAEIGQEIAKSGSNGFRPDSYFAVKSFVCT